MTAEENVAATQHMRDGLAGKCEVSNIDLAEKAAQANNAHAAAVKAAKAVCEAVTKAAPAADNLCMAACKAKEDPTAETVAA